MKKLSQLNVGEKAIIASFEDDAVPVKLLELGCLPGNQIALHSIAPLKDPICVELEGSQIAIRRETAVRIFVETV
ncbi:MAG: FeoA family protein [Flavobacteriaceae bacterium]